MALFLKLEDYMMDHHMITNIFFFIIRMIYSQLVSLQPKNIDILGNENLKSYFIHNHKCGIIKIQNILFKITSSGNNTIIRFMLFASIPKII